ncbi:polysaccharide biosynthesis tyrosine autokinase [Rubritalea sp.]|uniref:polysaccharide biosynthesis tyrosine autokinase n=1 Tax=Rubritalea sp. TaxID=2109375 RepID=UPI003EF620F7
MSRDIDPFADDAVESRISLNEELPVTNRLGMSNIRQALGRWWIMLIFGILGYCGALYYMSVKPPSNEALAVLEVDMKDERILGAELNQERSNAELRIATEMSKVTGPAILAATAESPEVQALQKAIPPKFSFKPRYMRTEEELAYAPASSVEISELVGKMAGAWISVNGRKGTSLIEVRVSHPDPEAARVIADTLIKVYKEREESQLVGGSADAVKILKKEADNAKLSLESSEKSVQVYVSAIKLSEQIQAKRAEVIVLRQRYLPKHPARIQEEAIYSDLLKRFGREIKRSSEKPSEKAYWFEYRDQLDALEKIVVAGGTESSEAADEWVLLAQSALATRANLLNGTVSQAKNQYESITRRMTEIDVADDREMNSIKIIEPAFVSMTGDSMRLIYLAAGSVLGVFVGFGVAYLLSVIDYKIYDVRSAEEATGLTALAAIPASTKFNRKKEWQSVLQHDPHSANSEAIRNLRASVVLFGKQERNKILLITSAIPGEGKTTISAELAAAFAMNKERTLLVDLDLRRPKLTETFPQLKGAPGVVEVLAGQAKLEDVFHDTDIPHLKVLGSGNRAPNPSELLHEAEFVTILEQLGPRFDRIILDSAPVLPVADSRLLAKHAHSVILVVRTRKTPIGAILRARDLLKFAGAKVGGVVVNGMRGNDGNKYHGYKGFGEYGAEDYGYYGDKK